MSRHRYLCGAVGAGTLAVLALAAPATASVSLVVNGVDGTYTQLQSRSPGVYGVELRGGRAGAADWEIAAGNWTSVSGKFNQGEFNWAASTNPYDFSLSWTASGLSITVGGVTVTDAGDGKGAPLIGNTLKVDLKGVSLFNLAAIDGVTFNQGWATPQSLLFYSSNGWGGDGFTATGTLSLENGGGSRNGINFKVGTFEANGVIPEPATWAMMIAGFGFVGAALRRTRRAAVTA